MQQEESIMILLVIVLLGICYFSPITSETFSNLNPQGSYISKNTFSPGPAVSQAKWKPGNLQNTYQKEPGPARSLNLNGTMDSFPFMEQSKKSSNEKINLIKPDGVILGGYLPQIIRPSDNVTPQSKGDKCNFPCYSDLKQQKWCSEKVAMDYYAMRPLINSEQYNKMLKKMFNHITDKGLQVQNIADEEYTTVFCTESKESLMAWLMQKIAKAVENMPDMQRNGSWKSERFYETDVQLYQFVNPSGHVHFKILFNLYNPLRSTSTMVVAEVYVVDGKPILHNIDFINEGEMGDYMPPANGWGPLNGQNTRLKPKLGGNIEQYEPLGFQNSPEGRKSWEDYYKKDPNEFDWNYQNTLEVQKFNKYGFYSNDPKENIEIEGGVPDSLKQKLQFCKEENLMTCTRPGFSGIMSQIDKQQGKMVEKSEFAPINGDIKNVQSNPSLIYSVPTLGLRDSKIEGKEQTMKPIGAFSR